MGIEGLMNQAPAVTDEYLPRLSKRVIRREDLTYHASSNTIICRCLYGVGTSHFTLSPCIVVTALYKLLGLIVRSFTFKFRFKFH
jgi:hypothetical protein